MISGGLLQQTAFSYEIASTDDLGHNANSWNLVGSFRCDLRDVGADERQYAQGVAIVRSYQVVCRWLELKRLGVNETHRLTIGSKTLRINAIRNIDEKNRRAEIDCTEVS